MKQLMHRTMLLLSLAVMGLPAAMAQPDDLPPPSAERLQEIKAQRSAYITTQLALTPEEAQQFWPVYNEMDEKQEALRREMRDMHKDGKADGAAMTEAQATQMLDKALANRQKELDLEKAYAERFKKSIGAVKTLKLKKAERDFNKEVLRKFRDRMEQQNGPGKGDGSHHR